MCEGGNKAYNGDRECIDKELQDWWWCSMKVILVNNIAYHLQM